MKKWTLVFALIFTLIGHSSMAQGFSPDYNTNFYDQVEYWDNYYATVRQDCLAVGNPSMQGTGYSGYDQWKEYWGLFVPTSGDFSEGYANRLAYNNQLKYEHLKGNTSGTNGNNALIVPPVNWNEIGPKNLDEILKLQGNNWVQPHINNTGLTQFSAHVAKIDRLFQHPTQNNIIYACAGGEDNGGGGLFVSIDNGYNWTVLGTDNIPNPDVMAFAIKPLGELPDISKEYLFIGLSSGAVYRSDDNGTNWIECGYNGLNNYPYFFTANSSNSLPFSNDYYNQIGSKNEQIGMIAFSPKNQSGSDYERVIVPRFGGLYYSDNYNSAIGINLNTNQISNTIVWDEFPLSTFTNLAGTVDPSFDHKDVWFTDFEWTKKNGLTYYFAHYQIMERTSGNLPLGNARQYVAVSTNFGATWTLLGANAPNNAQGIEIGEPNNSNKFVFKLGGNIEVLKNDPTYVYIASSTVENGEDPTNSFSLRRYNLVTNTWYDFSEYTTFGNRGMPTQPHGFVIDPENEEDWWFYTNAARKYKNGQIEVIVASSNSGAGSSYSKIHHADARDALILDNGDILLATDGGVYRSDPVNGGYTFDMSSRGLNAAQSNTVGLAQQPPFYISSGFWHCGTQILNPETGEWHQGGVRDGKGGDILFLNNEVFTWHDQLSNDFRNSDFNNLSTSLGTGGNNEGSENIDGYVYICRTDYQSSGIDDLIVHPNDFSNNGQFPVFPIVLGPTYEKYKATPYVIPNEPDKLTVVEFSDTKQMIYFYDGLSGANPSANEYKSVNLLDEYSNPNTSVRPFFGGITFDTRQNDVFWVIAQGASLPLNDTYGNRILEYDPLSDEFIDITFVTDDDINGFPPIFPTWYSITGIEHDRQTGVLYIGTTNGVYYLDRVNQIWRRYSSNVPLFNNEIGIIHCKGELYASSTNRGIWNTDLIRNEETPTLDWDIVENTTWEERMNLFCTLTVKTGYSLTIKDELMVFGNQKIIVEPGAKLIIDGGIITTECGEMWSGIELRGNSSLTQNATNQGVVQLKNSASIEFAYNAIRVIGIDDGDYIWGTTGGIVKIDEGKFRNCRRGIEFMAYQNLNASNVELKNQSYVFKAEFFTDDDMPVGVYPRAAISMWGVLGIKVKNCHFENQTSDLANVPIVNRGTGIHTIDATYDVVSGYALGSGNPVLGSENTFTNLFYGVFTTGGTSTSHVNVLDNSFVNCAYGVGLNGCNYGVVGRNEFSIPGGDYSFQDPYTGNWYNYGFGVYSQAAYGFNIESNEFKSLDPVVNLNTLSVHANNSSHVTGGKIYKNTVRNTTVGTQTLNNNENLNIDCNQLNKGSISIFDIHHAGGDLANQGNAFIGLPVNNEFIGNCDNNTDFQIYRSTLGFANNFEYFYQYGTLSPTCHNIGTYAIEDQNGGNNACASTLRNRISMPIEEHTGDLQSELLVIIEDIEKAEELLPNSLEPEILENAIRFLNTKRLITMDAIVSAYLDTNWIDSAIVFLYSEGSLEATKSLVSLEMKNNSANVAELLVKLRAEANRLESMNKVDPEVRELRAFCDFHELMVIVTGRPGGYFEMTAAELLEIENLAASDIEISGNAKSILYFLDEKSPVYSGVDPVLHEGEKWAESQASDLENSNLGFKVSPNPTSSEVVFTLDDDIEGYSIVVTDLKGKVIKILAVESNVVNYTFKNVQTGMYLAHLVKNQKIESTLKIIYDQQ